MAEITDREYTLLMGAINSNATAVSSLATTINDIARKLGERYITREEDERSDDRIRDELYTYFRAQGETLHNEALEAHRGITDQIKLCYAIISILAAALVAEGGWIIVHLK